MRVKVSGVSAAALLSAGLALTMPVHAATITVTDLTDQAAGTPPGSGAGVGTGTGATTSGDLRYAIQNADPGDVIEFACPTAPCTITLNGPLPPITRSLTIDGGSRGRIIIDGQNLYRALFADASPVTISNLRIQNVRAKGGNGGSGGGSVSAPGGGGAGLGAGLFVSTYGNVTVTAVDFANLAAVGGTGGSSVSVIGPASGGGGGLGGDGGNGQTGGNGAGGGGVLGAGSDNTGSNGGDGGLGGGGGGAADRPSNVVGTGGTGYGVAAGGDSGISADSGASIRGSGGNGGFGGGGGGAPNPSASGQSLGLGTAGNGGFGGGGGGADQQTDGGIPGPGGGGGGSSNLPVSGGVLMSGLRGGQGNNSRAGGGGGAAAGPAIFVYQGNLTVATSTVDNATATGGAGGTATWNPGLGGTAGGENASPIFNYDGNVNGNTARGPVNGILVGAWQGLTVARDGTGNGTVTASSGGLNCPGSCSGDVGTYTDVTLTAAAAADSTFVGWSGNCSGTTAAVTLTNVTSPQACTATFTLNPTPPTPTPSGPSAPAVIPSFVANPVPPVIDAGSGAAGAGSFSLASSFPNPASLSFAVGTVGGGALPSWLTFDPATATFTYQIPMPGPGDRPSADRAADVRAAGPNTIYPPALRAAKIPVVVSVTGNGQTYTAAVEMNFFYPRTAGVMAAASLGLDGAAGNAASGRSSQSFDGGQVVFETAALNLFADSLNSFTKIARYHGLSGARDQLSQTAIPGGGVANGADGASLSPAASADGRWAAFASDAPAVTLIPSGHVRQVYRASLVYPRVPLNEAATPTPDFISITADGIVGNGLSDNPAISQDGRYVAFDSVATNFAIGLDGTRHVWRKDVATGDLVLVGAGGNPSISWDGNWVALEADGRIQLKNMTTGVLQTIGSGTSPKLSARGDRLVYVNGAKVMLGDQAIADGNQPAISADGRFVVYRSAGQIRVMDVDRGASALVSQTSAGVAATGDSANPSISGDGSTIAFTSTARDLVGGNLAAGQLYLAANPLPLPDRTGYWYQANAANGQGWVMERWGTKTYLGGLVYDTDGRATWMTGFCTVKDLTCQGTLSGWTGGTAFGAAGPAAPVPTAGPGFTVTTEGRNASLTVGNATMALSPFPIGGSATTAYAGVPQAGWWYEPASGNSGNGYFLAVNTQVAASGAVQQVAYLSILTFDAQGRAVWYAAQGALGPGLSATLYQYSGGASVSGTAVGQVRLGFDGTDRATLNLPNGRSASLIRWRF